MQQYYDVITAVLLARRVLKDAIILFDIHLLQAARGIMGGTFSHGFQVNEVSEL